MSQAGCGRGRWTVALLGLALCAAAPASAFPIHGRVLSAAGRPLVGAEVTLAPMPSVLTPEADPAPAVRTVADAQGDFTLDTPEPGLWRLRLQAGGAGAVLCDLVPLLDAVEIPTVSLPAGAATAVSTPRVRCHSEDAGDAKKAAAPAGQPVTLRLLAPDGRPAAGVRAALEDGTLGGPSDADGRLQLNLPGGVQTAVRFWSADGAWAAYLLRPVAAEIRLEPPVTIAGTVVDRATRRPLPRALVWPAADPGRTVRSDERGAFTLKIPFLAAPALQAAAAGYQVATAAGLRPDRAAPTQQENLAVSLAPAAAVPGLVVDEAGKPVAGAEVGVVPAEAALPSGEVRGWSRTDAAGRFHLDGLEPGERLTARVRAAGFAALDSALPPVPAPVRLVMQRGRTVLGKVADAAGRPVQGAEVRAWPAGPGVRPEDLLRARDREMRQTTGRDGSFSFAAAAAGQLDLSVRATGASPAWLRGVEVPSGSGPFDLGRIVLAPELVLRGTVVDDAGAAVSGARVTAVPAATLPRPGDLAGGPPPADLTDADGRFALSGVETGARLFLRAERDGFLPASLEVEPRADGDPVVLTLEPAEALRGTVLDEEGGPVEGARIALLTGSGERLRPLASAMSDRLGAFSIAAAPPGSHHLAVQAAGYLPLLEPLAVEPGSKDAVEVRLARGASLSGRVVSERGEPVEGAGISLDMEETAGLVAPGTVSDSEGAYRLEGLPGGPREIRVLHPDYLPVRREIQLDGKTVQDFTLKAGAALAGQVVDEQGDPVSGAAVTVQAETDPIAIPQRFTDAEGRFRVPGLAPARYGVLVEQPGYASAELSGVEVGRGRPDLLVRLDRGATLFGQVHGLRAEERARLQVWASGPALVQKVGTVDPEGRYRIESLGAGAWRISARAEGLGREVSAPLNLAPDQSEAFLDLEFAAGYALAGAVTRGGSAVEGALVSVHGPDSAGTVTGPQGRFRIGPLTPGPYQIVVLDRATGASRSWQLDLDNDRETVFDLQPPEPEGSQKGNP